MRSLALKLMLAFLLVGATVVVVFVALVGQRTQTEVSRYISARDQGVLVEALNSYYRKSHSWQGIESTLARTPPLDYYSRGTILADAHGRVILGNTAFLPGQALPQQEMQESIALKEDDDVVGYLHIVAADGEPRQAATESAFVDRLGQAALLSAAAAALAALVVGGVLARTLTRPVRELTAATKAMAAGNLGQQVSVRSRDEIGELARSFNQMSADLSRASQSRKQMTADLAHDLRTPLSVLRGYTEGLRDGRMAGSPKLYGIMHDEVLHLQRLVEDLRTLSLADAGEMRLNRRAVDPAALLERAALAHFGQAEHRGIALRVESQAGLPSISVDTDRMAQVLNNLVSNALRHTAQGEIVLSAAADAGRVALKVRDTGSGIAPADLPYVFDRFYRADPSRQRQSGDDDTSGLGLAIAKAIVEAHGGTISVVSTPGQGSEFTIALGAAATA